MNFRTNERPITLLTLVVCVGAGVVLQAGVVHALAAWCSSCKTLPENLAIVRLQLATIRPPELVLPPKIVEPAPIPPIPRPENPPSPAHEEPSQVIEPAKPPDVVSPPMAPKPPEELKPVLRPPTRRPRPEKKPVVVPREAQVPTKPTPRIAVALPEQQTIAAEPPRDSADHQLTELLAQRRRERATRAAADRARVARPVTLPNVPAQSSADAVKKAEIEIQKWLRRVYRELDRRKVFPEEARRQNLTGAVQGSFLVAADGSIVRADVSEDAHPVLQTSTKKLLAGLRLPPPPAAWDTGSRVHCVIHYTSRGK